MICRSSCSELLSDDGIKLVMTCDKLPAEGCAGCDFLFKKPEFNMLSLLGIKVKEKLILKIFKQKFVFETSKISQSKTIIF